MASNLFDLNWDYYSSALNVMNGRAPQNRIEQCQIVLQLCKWKKKYLHNGFSYPQPYWSKHTINTRFPPFGAFWVTTICFWLRVSHYSVCLLTFQCAKRAGFTSENHPTAALVVLEFRFLQHSHTAHKSCFHPRAQDYLSLVCFDETRE